MQCHNPKCLNQRSTQLRSNVNAKQNSEFFFLLFFIYREDMDIKRRETTAEALL